MTDSDAQAHPDADVNARALDYHAQPTPGKIATAITKPAETQDDLSLAYTPGVAEPVRRIHANPDDAYRYTNKGNLVAVITDGTAVLGLGNVGSLAGKPVMEGKAVLFKHFAGIDCFDIEVNARRPQEFVETVMRIAPTFGGINLEDIAAPHCFEIEQLLIEELDIPVFHDDQHGTAIIICAGLLNALELQGKRLDQAIIVVLGAGAAGIAAIRLLMAMGAHRRNIYAVDREGVIHFGRKDLHPSKFSVAADTHRRTLAEAMVGADVFIGVSGPDLVITRDALRYGPQAHRLCAVQPGSGDPTRGRPRGPQRHDPGHRAQRLPQSGQQCAGLPLHLPRGTGRARLAHQ